MKATLSTISKRCDTRPSDDRLVYGEIVPIFRWAGSKRKSLQALTAFWSERFERYIEPFAGSACLFLRIKPKAAILADLNSTLIQTYRTIRRHPVAVAEALYTIPRNSTTYYDVRRRVRSPGNSIERAAFFVYLNRNCFNGIYRTNLDGDFNVPFGAEQGQYPRPCDFQTTAKLLKNAKLLSCDFGATLRHLRRNDFVYLDPPFAATGVRTFIEYGKKSFASDDLDRFSRILIALIAVAHFFWCLTPTAHVPERWRGILTPKRLRCAGKLRASLRSAEWPTNCSSPTCQFRRSHEGIRRKSNRRQKACYGRTGA